MTELDLYLQCVPMIAEMVVRCRDLSAQQYDEWKRETMEATPDTSKEFLGKIFIVVSVELGRIKKGCALKVWKMMEQHPKKT